MEVSQYQVEVQVAAVPGGATPGNKGKLAWVTLSVFSRLPAPGSNDFSRSNASHNFSSASRRSSILGRAIRSLADSSSRSVSLSSSRIPSHRVPPPTTSAAVGAPVLPVSTQKLRISREQQVHVSPDRDGPGAGAVEHEVGVRLNARFRGRSGPGEGGRLRSTRGRTRPFVGAWCVGSRPAGAGAARPVLRLWRLEPRRLCRCGCTGTTDRLANSPRSVVEPTTRFPGTGGRFESLRFNGLPVVTP